MEPFTIEVLGGAFRVERVVPQPGQPEEETLRQIHGVTVDRWFVVLHEPDDARPMDVLTLIDEELQIQSLATGHFIPESMEPFTIEVLGGTFTVDRVVPQPGQPEEEVLHRMHGVPPERWFVILDEPVDAEPVDALALIDDDLEFQTLATGSFTGES